MIEILEENSQAEIDEKEERALSLFRELAPSCDEDMIPWQVKYDVTDLNKATFYFKCEHRVDFRELVRQLSSELDVAVTMRQVSDREQASMVGGIGPCGQELCCSRLGLGCCKQLVTMKMAKNQNLTLNPAKISGMCGRLMCCLRYENEVYTDFNDRSPRIGSVVFTPDGEATVTSKDALREIVTLKVGEEKPVRVPLSDIIDGKKNKQDIKRVERSAWDEATQNTYEMQFSSSPTLIDTALFSKADSSVRLRGAKLIDREPELIDRPKKEGRKRRNRNNNKNTKAANNNKTASRPGGNSSALSADIAPLKRPKKDSGRTPRKRRTVTIDGNKNMN